MVTMTILTILPDRQVKKGYASPKTTDLSWYANKLSVYDDLQEHKQHVI